MGSALIIKKTYQVEYRDELFTISLKENEAGLMTGEFKPPEFLKYFGNKTLDSEDEFLKVWLKYIIGLSICREEKDIMERNIGALTFITMDHVEENGSIDSDTLFKFVDCFSSALYHCGVSIQEIRQAYVPISKGLIECFEFRVIDKETGKVFKETPYYNFLSAFLKKSSF